MIGSVRLSLQPKYLIFDLCQIFFLFPQFAQGFPLIAKVLKRIRGQFMILVFLVNIQRIRGLVHDSCLSCEYSILWEGIEFIK